MNIIVYILLLIVLIFLPVPTNSKFSYYFFMKYIALNKGYIYQEETKESLQKRIYAIEKELQFAKQIIQDQSIKISSAFVNTVSDNSSNANIINNFFNNNSITDTKYPLSSDSDNKSININESTNANNKINVNEDSSSVNKKEEYDLYSGILIYSESFLQEKLIYIYTKFLNKIKIGDYVIYNKQLIGTIQSKNDNFAYVKLISNKNSNIPVINVRNRDRYIATGANQDSNKIQLKYIDKQNSPQKGDILILDFEDFNNLNINIAPIVVGAINLVAEQCVIVEQDLEINKAKYVFIMSKQF